MVKEFSDYFPGLSQPFSICNSTVNATAGNVYVAASEFSLLNAGETSSGGAINIINSVRIAITLSKFTGCMSGRAGGAIFVDPLGKDNGLYIEKCIGSLCYTYSSDPDVSFYHQGQWAMAITNSDSCINTITYCSIEQCAPYNYFTNQRPIAAVNGHIDLNNLNISNCVSAYCGGFYVDGGFDKVSNVILANCIVEKYALIEVKNCTGKFHNVLLLGIQHNTDATIIESYPLLIIFQSNLIFDFLNVVNCTSKDPSLLRVDTQDGDSTILFNNSYVQGDLSIEGFTSHYPYSLPLVIDFNLFNEEQRQSEKLDYLHYTTPPTTIPSASPSSTPDATPSSSDEQDDNKAKKNKVMIAIISVAGFIVLAAIIVAVVIAIIRYRGTHYNVKTSDYADGTEGKAGDEGFLTQDNL
ncbi:hypothetical protein TVAG_148100 [Trichomonas vaginalis G3]|uniref:Right handed beta helix domain-containing protein n=1 Tax=Trichomonas vaginalis (strain ATCC PRA-98 / G3) TaxID=412133 RepID=A2FQW8_TRIV3|nr:hypothetical protein TVAGG3_0959300 [Trichomonas vaginalis G3]EAX92707.1 hypothetical protein TVAG_148100 [Trichomonas vaginalis G3]KAI5487785.1 hypothetical protein TVAGG3_0959300 [Trichomonas vaginalis G3]|eukprot:XP_001305637.1 hypothetical protein [Trichomonas vaginalis G3]